MPRILSTEEAKTAIRQIQSIVNGGFTDQIDQIAQNTSPQIEARGFRGG